MLPRMLWRRVAATLVIAAAVAVAAGTADGMASGAAAQDPASNDSLLAEGYRLTIAKRYDEATTIYDHALALARERVREAEIASALLSRSDLRLRQRLVAPGIADAVEALEIWERLDAKDKIAQTRVMLGSLEAAQGNHQAATVLMTEAIDGYSALGDRASAARAGLRLVNIINDIDHRVPVFTRAAENARLAGDAELEGSAFHRLGDALFNSNRFEESMVALDAAAVIFRRIGLTGDIGTVHNSMGRVYRAHGRLDEALRQQQLALELHRKSSDPVLLLQSLNAVGVTYQRMGYFEEARSYLEQALALAPSATGAPNARDFLEANMAGLLLNFGQHSSAATTLERVIARGVDVFPAIRWAQLSNAYSRLGRHAEALKAATESIALCGTAIDTCARAYGARAEALVALGSRAAARSDGQTALGLIERLRKQLILSDVNRREFADSMSDVYTGVIRVNVADGEARAALEAAEQARARAFVDLLESRSLEPPVAPAPAALPLTLRGAPVARQLYTSASAATADDLVATAARLRSTLVAYWVGDDDTFVWVVNRNGAIRSERIQVSRSTLVRLVREIKPFDDVASPGSTPGSFVTRGKAPLSLRSADAAWRQLYALLIAPIRGALPTAPGALLTIIPHDVLNGVSFAAMKSPRGRYLLEDFTLHYAPAGATFQFTAARHQADARSGSVLLVADPAPGRRSALDEQLPRLPGTRAETAAIANYVRRGGATILQDTAASEARLRELSPRYSVVHLATHAIVSEDNPLGSQLMLTRTGVEADRDGVLTAEEVYEMRLNADLIVLSACRSAAGAVPGEAMSTFARAFLYAGTASLVASVWDVPDEPTNQLIPAFYRGWLAGADKAVALRRAQLRLLADLRAGRVQATTSIGPVPLPEHPVFWAGFVLFGEPR